MKINLIFFLLGASLINQAQWVKQNQFLTSNTLFDIRMFDSEEGLCVGEGNILLCTLDGGSTFWDGGGSFAPDIQTASLAANGIIYFGNQDGTIYYEDEAGECNNEILALGTPNTDDLIDLVHLNANDAFAVANGRIVFTENAWNSSSLLPEVDCPNDALSIALLNDTLGFVGSLDGKIYRIFRDGPVYDCSLAHDGPSVAIRDIFFYDENSVWAVGDNGLVLMSNDAGLSWSSASFPLTEDLFSVISPAPGITFVAGNKIYRYEQDTETWFLCDQPTNNPSWKALWFVNANEGWAVGEQGWILHTENALNGGQELTPSHAGITETVEIDIFPNPVSDMLSINHPFSSLRYKLYDLHYKLHLSGSINQSGNINVSALKSGTYLIELVNSDFSAKYLLVKSSN
jgi:photosystem II stability/assembly factor-like uncharacterized protein